jgi:hypothetical protein
MSNGLSLVGWAMPTLQITEFMLILVDFTLCSLVGWAMPTLQITEFMLILMDFTLCRIKLSK